MLARLVRLLPGLAMAVLLGTLLDRVLLDRSLNGCPLLTEFTLFPNLLSPEVAPIQRCVAVAWSNYVDFQSHLLLVSLCSLVAFSLWFLPVNAASTVATNPTRSTNRNIIAATTESASAAPFPSGTSNDSLPRWYAVLCARLEILLWTTFACLVGWRAVTASRLGMPTFGMMNGTFLDVLAPEQVASIQAAYDLSPHISQLPEAHALAEAYTPLYFATSLRACTLVLGAALATSMRRESAPVRWLQRSPRVATWSAALCLLCGSFFIPCMAEAWPWAALRQQPAFAPLLAVLDPLYEGLSHSVFTLGVAVLLVRLDNAGPSQLRSAFERWFERFFALPMWGFFARISYPIYMIHMTILHHVLFRLPPVLTTANMGFSMLLVKIVEVWLLSALFSYPVLLMESVLEPLRARLLGRNNVVAFEEKQIKKKL